MTWIAIDHLILELNLFAITLKSNLQNVSISNIIMRNDSFNEKAMEVNGYLKQLCIEKNIFLIDHTKTIHSRNINRSKLHLNKSGSIILSNNFVKAMSSISHWYEIDGNNKGCLKVKECNSVPQNVSFNNELNSMRIKHVNKLIIAHLNINSLRNKFEFLVEFIRGKVDILMISETKNVPFRLDGNINGGGIMLFVREDIPAW